MLSAVLAALFATAWFLPRHIGSEALGRWSPKTPFIPNHLRNVFAVAAAAVTTAYTHGVLILSLGSQVARDLVGSPNALVNGAALSLFAIASAVVGIGARRLQPRAAMTGGAAASALGMVLLAAAVAHHHLPVFLAATAISGAGYSLLFFGGLQTINSVAPAEHRGGVLSAIYLLALRFGEKSILQPLPGLKLTGGGILPASKTQENGQIFGSVSISKYETEPVRGRHRTEKQRNGTQRHIISLASVTMPRSGSRVRASSPAPDFSNVSIASDGPPKGGLAV
ncbi:hypothetical protein UP10_31485 [Bradyrhizobium sp. LTSPM299]|nr:hypothetical protein UP10_31485 [Bradyrhizobium sp. LTSPM299]